jgi:hypothetical protein
LVEKGVLQQTGVDYGDAFAPVASLYIVRVVLATTGQNKCKVYQMDVNSTLLNDTLEEEVYVEKPPGYVIK